MRLTVTVYDTNNGKVDLEITGPEGCSDCGVDTIGNVIPWAAKGNKPRCFDDKRTWDLTVGGDGQVSAVVTWGGVKYNVNRVDAGNMNGKAARITTYNMPFKYSITLMFKQFGNFVNNYSESSVENSGAEDSKIIKKGSLSKS
ncbi:uncharacterized protein Bfra_009621 [Botrytis fragariae]|uniref:Uncharacterized protein n=1 Tax=Botrytis fragariae TaxID=1964551 RepID=A0A8H6AMU5_9HELO|nr:uncharacterized protein Bfra_009621 [Botrytis fragariae]KAF5870238.1 hypothetical protein Bfra_009621 [Botrytis fragariae]